MTGVLEIAPTRAGLDVRTIRVAVAGAGTVGGALLELVDNSRAQQRRHGIRFEVTRILVRDPARRRARPGYADRYTTDPDALLDNDVDMVVEAMGGLDPALRIATAALQRGVPYVTANKALLATHGARLSALAARSGARIGFEATVAGGVPVVRVLRDALSCAGVRRIRGILNGTSNFILDQVHQGASAAAALAAAQRAGFAEADPSRDLLGQDSADKIALLAWLAFGHVPGGEFPVRGIASNVEEMVADARAAGGVARLVAECSLAAGCVTCDVAPVALPPTSALARTVAEDNTIIIESAWNGSIVLSGPGAGGAPTASALLADMLAVPPPPACHAPAQASVSIGSAAAPSRSGDWLLSVDHVPGAAHHVSAVLSAARPWPRGQRTDSNRLRFHLRGCDAASASSAAERLAALRLRPVLLRSELAGVGEGSTVSV